MVLKEHLRLLTMLVGFPALYILFSLSSWNHKLFVENQSAYYFLFFGGIMLLHWVSFYIVTLFLKQENSSLKEIGYLLSKSGTVKLVVLYVLVGIGLLFAIESLIANATLDNENWQKATAFIPKTTGQRVFFVVAVFTAGFCEELIYRGYLITKIEKLGLSKWLAMVPAGVSFVCIHGMYGISNFWFYFIPALVFGAIFILSKRLLPGILLHFAYNLMAMFAITQYLQ